MDANETITKRVASADFDRRASGLSSPTDAEIAELIRTEQDTNVAGSHWDHMDAQADLINALLVAWAER